MDILTQLVLLGLPLPTTEHAFAPPRRWRFDYCWLVPRVAAEREGGVWTGGRHTRGKGYTNDCRKYSEAAVRGWCVVRFTPEMERSGEAAELIRRALEARG